MKKRIITISREFGSGGRFIGEEVAKKLGIAYYDKNIIGQIAEKSGLSPEYIQENAELSPKKGLFAYAFSGRDITGKSVDTRAVSCSGTVCNCWLFPSSDLCKSYNLFFAFYLCLPSFSQLPSLLHCINQ